MAGDRNVPRRIRKNHLGPLVSEKPGVALAHQGICAKDAMLAEQPEISQLRHRRRGLVQRRQIILFVVAGAFEGDVDLGSNPGAPASQFGLCIVSSGCGRTADISKPGARKSVRRARRLTDAPHQAFSQ